MNKTTLLLLIFALCSLQACGQKGPLEVERPQVQQEEEASGTR